MHLGIGRASIRRERVCKRGCGEGRAQADLQAKLAEFERDCGKEFRNFRASIGEPCEDRVFHDEFSGRERKRDDGARAARPSPDTPPVVPGGAGLNHPSRNLSCGDECDKQRI